MLAPGQTLGRYELVRTIATGGMATVWLAQLAGAHGFEKWVAVKVIQPRLAKDPHLVSMFLDEVRVVSRVRHTNVCSVLDLGVTDEVPYLVMEYLSGVPFSAALRRGWRNQDVPPEVVARIVADAARGLHAAHELRGDDGELLGVVHRDVSPQNIVVQHDGAVKVVDFGIAQARGKLAVTRVGELKGKLSYMAPEQLLLAPVDRRADVWSLGVLLWEATLGRRLFYTEDRVQTGQHILRAPIPRPREVNAEYPEALETVVLGALERDPSRRTPSAAALADALERWLYSTGEPCGAAQLSAWLTRHFGEPRDPSAAATPSETSLPAQAPARETAPVPNQPPRLASLGHAAPTKLLDRPSRASRKRSYARIALAAAAVVLVPAAWAIFFRDGEPPRSTATAPPPPAAAQAVPAPARAPAARETAPRDPAPAKAAVARETAPADPAPTEAAAADVTEPAAADVTEPDTAAARATDPPRSRRTRAVPRPSRERGWLNLLAIPQSTVSWRGRTIGRTPLFEHALPAGRHTLTLRPVGGGSEERIVVHIRPDDVTHERVRLDGY